MKLARYVTGRIGAGAGALALAGAALIGGAPAAGAAVATAHGSSLTPAQTMTAWVGGPGYRYLTATDAALDARNGPALEHYATLAAAHPQPADTADYVAMMRAYAAAGAALAQGETRLADADIAWADDVAWDVVQDTFSVLDRVSIGG
jgi:hypothetical protein